MFPAMQVEDEEYVLRPMNCPHHMRIYANRPRSYRNLPLRIGEIAEKLGFEDIDYFSKVFRKTTGISPREYRRKNDER